MKQTRSVPAWILLLILLLALLSLLLTGVQIAQIVALVSLLVAGLAAIANRTAGRTTPIGLRVIQIGLLLALFAYGFGIGQFLAS